MARDFVALDGKARKRALVIEPSRDGRDTLTGKIREKLAEAGALRGPAIELSRLVIRDMTRTEAKEAGSYAVGDVVRFTKDYADKGVSRRDAYTVAGIDTEKAAVILKARDGRHIDWRLRQWGATQSQVFTAEPIELRAGDRVQFSRNDRAAGRVNGQQGEVIGVDPAARTVTLRMANRRIERLTPDDPRDRHIAHAWVATAFAAQGRTADRVLVHADSTASQLVDQKSFYVALSRARESVAVYTNDRAKLVAAIQERSGVKQVALEAAVGIGKAASAQIGNRRGRAAAKAMAL
jgi:ATP-dependent exoDNAse (exonuclease V) alpha subunit